MQLLEPPDDILCCILEAAGPADSAALAFGNRHLWTLRGCVRVSREDVCYCVSGCPQSTSLAAAHGHIQCMMEAQRKGWDQDTTYKAARNGHTAAMLAAVNNPGNPCPWHPETTLAVAWLLEDEEVWRMTALQLFTALLRDRAPNLGTLLDATAEVCLNAPLPVSLDCARDAVTHLAASGGRDQEIAHLLRQLHHLGGGTFDARLLQRLPPRPRDLVNHVNQAHRFIWPRPACSGPF